MAKGDAALTANHTTFWIKTGDVWVMLPENIALMEGGTRIAVLHLPLIIIIIVLKTMAIVCMVNNYNPCLLITYLSSPRPNF